MYNNRNEAFCSFLNSIKSKKQRKKKGGYIFIRTCLLFDVTLLYIVYSMNRQSHVLSTGILNCQQSIQFKAKIGIWTMVQKYEITTTFFFSLYSDQFNVLCRPHYLYCIILRPHLIQYCHISNLYCFYRSFQFLM